MVRVFRSTEEGSSDDAPWSFTYTDWQGKRQVGVGTESKVETQHLAERVQAEHDVLRQGMRRTSDKPKSDPPEPPLPDLELVESTPPIEFSAPSEAPRPAPPSKKTEDAERAKRREGGDDRSLKSTRLGDQLVEASFITEGQLVEALAYQKRHGGRIVNILIQLEYLTADAFLMFMGKRRGVPRFVLANYRNIPDDVLELVSAELAAELEVIPIDRIGKILTVAMVCPVDEAGLKRLQEQTKLNVRPMLCSRAEFREALQRFYHRNAFMAPRRPFV